VRVGSRCAGKTEACQVVRHREEEEQFCGCTADMGNNSMA
jgi:hypothetical protein